MGKAVCYKVPYETKNDNTKRLKTYKCPFCDKWHLTSKKIFKSSYKENKE